MTNFSKQPRTKGLFLPPLLQLILSAIGLSTSLLMGALSLLGGVFALIEDSLSAELMTFFSAGWSAFLVGALFLLPLIQSVKQLTGKETHFSQKNHFRTASVLMVMWVPLLLFGQLIAKNGSLPWLFLPPLQIILIASPIFFLIEFARRKLNHPEGGPAGVYSIGVVITQPLVILVELVSLLGVGILVIAWITTQPALMDEITLLGQQVTNLQMDPQAAQDLVLPYLQKPAVILGVMSIGAGLIPLIEELMKPLALWVMIGRKLDEPSGFVLGLYAGGTFALLESLGMAVSSTGEDWASVIAARLGTGVLHITTAALMGWGLAAAWKNRKYIRLGLTLLVSFTLHAVWNFFGLYSGIQQLNTANGNPSFMVVLGFLAVGMIIILVAANRHLQKMMPEAEDTQPLISTQTATDVKMTE